MPSSLYQAQFILSSRADLPPFAKQLARWLVPGDVIALNGTLGAGKTTLTQALGRALGITETVSSPTFVLMNDYRTGRYPVTHVDLYRLGEDRAHSLAEELFAVIDEGRSVVLVEWACYGAFLAEAITMSLQIEHLPDMGPEMGEEARRIHITANRPLWQHNASPEGNIG